MSNTDKDFFEELRAMFIIEAEEHIKIISNGLIELEKSDSKVNWKDIIESIYRETHSLKGAARAVNLKDVEIVCQSVENVFSAIKKKTIDLNRELFDILHDSVDVLTEIIIFGKKVDISDIMPKLSRIEYRKKKIIEDKPKEVEVRKIDKNVSVDTKNKLPKKKTAKPVNTENISSKIIDNKRNQPNTELYISDTIRVSSSKLDKILLQAEEMLATKLSAQQQTIDVKNILNFISDIRNKCEKHSQELKMVKNILIKNIFEIKESNSYYDFLSIFDFIDDLQDKIKNIEGRLVSLLKLSDHNHNQLDTMVNLMLNDVKKILMLPFSNLIKTLPKIVRDLSRDQGKEIELIIKGSTIEVDRRILEEMKDPFVHLLRNCIDHGIENPEERKKSKKPKKGTITISIIQKSNGIINILLSDNGGGIDPEEVKDVAIKRGIISSDKAKKLSIDEKIDLIFLSDVSTSPIITDVSGRGLGLPIVREKVENLGGSINLETDIGKGTTFSINLPVTLATFRGILVEVKGSQFIIPTTSVLRVVRINNEDIKTVKNKETISYNGDPISFVRMENVLDLFDNEDNKLDLQLLQTLIIDYGKKRVAFSVDEIVNEQEVLVKNLGSQLGRVRNISGSTILGAGKIVPILNVSDLMKSSIHASNVDISKRLSKKEKVVKKSVLIAEDSITSRTLLKNILESAGYQVKTTVDGAEAYSVVTGQQFDLVVSDVEMPRMNGFELVSKIRKNKKTSELPIVLVTALESDEDKKRGIDVGADAYIVKRSFDQSNLINVISKLI